MKKRALSTKLLIGGILLTVAPIAITGVISVIRTEAALSQLSDDSVVSMAQDLADLTQIVLKEEIKTAKHLSVNNIAVSALEEAKNGGKDAARKLEALSALLAKTHSESESIYEEIVALDANGTVVADWENNPGDEMGGQACFKAAQEGRSSVSEPIRSEISGDVLIPFSSPVTSASGEFLGAIVLLPKLDLVSGIITSKKLGETGYAFVADHEGTVIIHQNESLVLSLDLNTQEGMETLVKRATAGETGVERYVFKGVEKICGFAPVELTGWSIVTTQPTVEFLASAHHIRNMTLLVGGISLAVAIGLILAFSRGITIPINRIIQNLNDGADQVASSSDEIAKGGQSLASGASEQAAAIEETSSSLEEMSAMTKQNAHNADIANGLMKDTNSVVQETNGSMSELTASMQEIIMASEETSKIIKTIDEIAFQTNLLALNAAVEAARAGDSGAGFAVVADEVRNLAMRSAEAAKNTAELIEDTVKKVSHGSGIVAQAFNAFKRVEENAAKVEELIAELSSASKEQAQGVGQINQAVAEMDKVVQMNAANAEESASAGEEMNTQAVQMKSIVDDLLILIRGGEKRR